MSNTETIVLAGGCFWCIEAQFQRVRGVISVENGYTGGDSNRITYQEVKTGTTGHYEVIKITFDTNQISLFRKLSLIQNF